MQRACDLQALINNDAIRRFVSGVQTLPALPNIYVKLTGLLENERSGVAEIARVIEQDPAMCAKILQLVNSSFIGLGRTISDVEQAISYLGLNLLKNLTLVVRVFNVRPLSETHRLRILARPLGLAKIDATEAVIKLQFIPNPPIDPARIIQLVQQDRRWKLAGPDRLVVSRETATLPERAAAIREIISMLNQPVSPSKKQS